jgi:hypothetical protein
MNLERFHSMVIRLTDELDETNQAALLEQLVSQLRAMGSEPGQPQHQQSVSDTRVQLGNVLANADSNDYETTSLQSLDELGIRDMFGEPLRGQIEAVLSANEMTPSAAADQLEPLSASMKGIHSTLHSIRGNFEALHIEREDLAPGDFEVGFLIPRAEVDDQLKNLGEEFVKIHRLLRPFFELTGDNQPSPEVRSIASSDFSVFLHSPPGTMLAISGAVKYTLDVYSKVLDIRLKHHDLKKDDDVPDEALEGIRKHAETRMTNEIEKIAENLVQDLRKKDEGRANEIKIELVISLKGMADRIDRGYGIEVRSGPLPEATEDDEAPVSLSKEEEAATRFITNNRKSLNFVKVSAEPILQLSDGDPDEKPKAKRKPKAKAKPKPKPKA